MLESNGNIVTFFIYLVLENFYGQSSNQQRSGTVPPRMQQQSHSQQPQQQQDGSANRPKRYSSLRQRPNIADNPGQQNYPSQHGQHAQHGQHNQHGYFPPQGNPYIDMPEFYLQLILKYIFILRTTKLYKYIEYFILILNLCVYIQLEVHEVL